MKHVLYLNSPTEMGLIHHDAALTAPDCKNYGKLTATNPLPIESDARPSPSNPTNRFNSGHHGDSPVLMGLMLQDYHAKRVG